MFLLGFTSFFSFQKTSPSMSTTHLYHMFEFFFFIPDPPFHDPLLPFPNATTTSSILELGLSTSNGRQVGITHFRRKIMSLLKGQIFPEVPQPTLLPKPSFPGHFFGVPERIFFHKVPGNSGGSYLVFSYT